METPLLLHEGALGEPRPGELALEVDRKAGVIKLALIDQDGSGMCCELDSAEAVDLVLKLVGSVARLRNCEEPQ